MAQKIEELPLQFHHGHTDTQIYVQFNRPVNNILLTPEQADAMITCITKSKAMLLEHLAKKPKNG